MQTFLRVGWYLNDKKKYNQKDMYTVMGSISCVYLYTGKHIFIDACD